MANYKEGGEWKGPITGVFVIRDKGGRKRATVHSRDPAATVETVKRWALECGFAATVEVERLGWVEPAPNN